MMGSLIKLAASQVVKESLFQPVAKELAETVKDLKVAVVDSKCKLAKAGRLYNESLHATYTAIEMSLGFMSAVEQFASWCSSSDRITRVMMALEVGDITKLVSLRETAKKQVEQVQRKHGEFTTKHSKAMEKVNNEIEQCKRIIATTDNSRRTSNLLGGIASGTFFVAGAAAVALAATVCAPIGVPAIVGTAVGATVLEGFGIAAAVTTGVKASNLKESAESLKKLAVELEKLCKVADSLARYVERVNTKMTAVVDTLQLAEIEHIVKEDVIDAVKLLMEEASNLHEQVCDITGTLKGIRDQLKPSLQQ
jgi:predicted transcriptional regulator